MGTTVLTHPPTALVYMRLQQFFFFLLLFSLSLSLLIYRPQF